MSNLVADWQAKRSAAKAPPKREPDPDGGSRWNAQERRALRTLRREARAAGATLASNGEGGIAPSRVLGVMRRDGFACKVCGRNQNLGLHHKSEHLEDPKAKARSLLLRRQGRVDDPSNLTTICESKAGYEGCHDRVHRKDREEHGEPGQQQ